MSDTENLATARRYIAALSRGGGADEVSQFYAHDVVQEGIEYQVQKNL